MTFLDKKINFFALIFFFFALHSVAMENLEKTFGHINFDYALLRVSISSLFGDDTEEFFVLIDDISDDNKRQSAKKLVFERATLKTRGASLRILAAIKRWEENHR